MKYIDQKFSEICAEVDYWKEEAKYWEEKFNSLQKEMDVKLADDLKRSQKGIGQMLSLAFAIKEQPDGSIAISKENRKGLAEVFTKSE